MLGLALTASASDEFRLDGVGYVNISLDGEKHPVPIINPRKRVLMYEAKRAIEADDAIAREMLLAGEERRMIFIGNGEPKWLVITKDDEWVQSVLD